MTKVKWTIDAVTTELKKIISEHGYIPPLRVLHENGLNRMCEAIFNHYGGIVHMRKELGVDNLKKCVCCEKVKDRSLFRKRQKATKGKVEHWVTNVCMECEKSAVIEYRDSWRGHAADMCRRARYRAKKKGYAFSIDKEWLYNRMIEADFCCEATGLKLVRNAGQITGRNAYHNPMTASLDKINPKGGYTKDNVQVVCSWYNWSKSAISEKEHMKLVTALVVRKGE